MNAIFFRSDFPISGDATFAAVNDAGEVEHVISVGSDGLVCNLPEMVEILNDDIIDHRTNASDLLSFLKYEKGGAAEIALFSEGLTALRAFNFSLSMVMMPDRLNAELRPALVPAAAAAAAGAL